MQLQPITINFAQGLNTKTDPKQITVGQFQTLENSVFTNQGLLQKRNGYPALTQLPQAANALTTFNGNLTAIGTSIQAYIEGSKSWINKGNFQPLSLNVLPVSRSAFNQTQCDSIVSANGLICTVFTEINAGVSTYKYVIANLSTGQNVISPVAIPVGSGVVTGSPRVFFVGSYFFIVFTNVISAVSHLQYIAVSSVNPTIVTTNADIAAAYIPSTTLSWDGVVLGNNLYIAYNTTSGGQQIAVTFVTSNFVVASPTSFSGSIATMMSMYVDTFTPTNPVIYFAYYDSAGSTGFVAAVDPTLAKLMTPTQIISSGTVLNITLTANKGVAQIIYEVANNYSYDSSIATNFLDKVNVTLPATVTTGTVSNAVAGFVRSIGLASKAFVFNNLTYFVAEYASTLQSTYFLISIAGNVIARFAYENGGATPIASTGYLPAGLPQAQVIGSTVYVSYLFKDLIQSQSTSGIIPTIGKAGLLNIYSQTGVNNVAIDFTTSTLATSEIGKSLNITGGMLWSYDGNLISEQGFHLFPDYVELTLVADPAPTGTVSNVTTPTLITSMSSVAGIVVGMNISGAGIPANTTVVAVGTTTVTMSASATAAHSSETITFTGNVSAQQYYYQVIYEFMDANGNLIYSAGSIPVTITATSGHSSVAINIPTLRLTYKPNVKIVVYRWSVAQQTYNQDYYAQGAPNSITNPLLSSTSSDSVLFTDIASDAQINGNGFIYTNGGVVEDIAGPSCVATTLFDDRLWLVDAEDRNLLWYSKQIIENTPVEMSDLFTFYVAPTTGAQGSTGNITALAPLDANLIIFKKDAIYYINGVGPDNTGANNQYSQPIFITSTVGCTDPSSTVVMNDGLMFESDKGIWLLNHGLQVSYIGAAVERFNSSLVNSANIIPGTTQARFTLDTGETLMYDYYYQQWGTFKDVPAISSTLYQDLHTYLSPSGFVAQELPGNYLDNGNPTTLQFTTGPIWLAGITGFQRAIELVLTGSYVSPHKLLVTIEYDFGKYSQQYIITPNNYTGLYGSDSLYGQTSPFGGPGELEDWRIQFDNQQCQSIQVSIQELYDPTQGQPAGAGFTLSSITVWVGIKKAIRPFAANKTVG